MAKLIIGFGYLGEAFVACHPPKSGLTYFATTRTPERAAEIREDWQGEPLVCDVLQPRTLMLPQVDTVLYCVGFDRKAGLPMRTVYVEGLRNVLDSLPRPRRFLYVSSTSVYGQRDASWVDETAPTEPVDDSGQVMLEAERLLHSHLPEAVILRFAGIYGPWRLLRQQAIQKGEPLTGDPEGWLNLIHVTDGGRAVLAAEQVAQPGQIYNIADGYPGTRRQFYTELARLLDAPPPTFLGAGNETQQDTVNRRIRNQRMRQELKVHPHYPSFEEGLPAALRRMKSAGI